MSSSAKLSNKEYTEFLQAVEFKPASYEEISESLKKNGVREMYHAMVNEKDIVTLFKIPNLKIFWICRCHHVAEDKSSSHEHLHALVQYQNKKTHQAFKLRLKRAGKRMHAKTTFKKIICPDHMIGTLRYISCGDGQKLTRRNSDGLMGAPHTHYRRSVFDNCLLHKRSSKQIIGCKDVRLAILRGVRNKLSDKWIRDNVSGHHHYLHHHETCLCEFGKIGKEKKKAANQKRRDFYNTEPGQEIKKRYRDRAQQRRELIQKVMELQTGSNLAEMEKESILDLLKRMK